MKKFRIGVDIGGTNIKIALVDFDGKIIYSNTTERVIMKEEGMKSTTSEQPGKIAIPSTPPGQLSLDAMLKKKQQQQQHRYFR